MGYERYYGSDVGGYCSTLKIVNVPCPKIQDPDFTYNHPKEATQESQKKIDNINNLIQQWDRLYPKGSLGGQ